MLVWNWTYALHWLYPAWPYPYFWLNLTYVGAVSTPVLVFIYTLLTVGVKGFTRPSVYIALAIEPLLTLALLWTDQYHSLFFGGFSRQSLIYQGGPWFWLNIIYSYGLLAITYYLLLRAIITARARIYRTQLTLYIMGISVPILASISGVLGFHPMPGLDLIPIGFLLGSIFLVINLSAFQMVDMLPIAHDQIVDQMTDGMVVMDENDRILDINPPACEFLGRHKDEIIGKDKSILGEQIARRVTKVSNQNEFFQLTSTRAKGDAVTLGIRISPLIETRGRQIGKLIIWQNITHLKQVEEELRKANSTLSDQLKKIEGLQRVLQEQVIRDPLTGLFNRRFLEDSMPKEIARALRTETTISFVMLDIDHFKHVNDQYGHEVGDEILKRLADLITSTIRISDWAVRYGGEEFLLVLLGSTVEDAFGRVENIREQVMQISCLDLGMDKGITVSLGIAEFPRQGHDWQKIVKLADEALYQAKAAGRNCVKVCMK